MPSDRCPSQSSGDESLLARPGLSPTWRNDERVSGHGGVGDVIPVLASTSRERTIVGRLGNLFVSLPSRHPWAGVDHTSDDAQRSGS